MLDGLAKVWNGKSKNDIDDLDGTPHLLKPPHISTYTIVNRLEWGQKISAGPSSLVSPFIF